MDTAARLATGPRLGAAPPGWQLMVPEPRDKQRADTASPRDGRRANSAAFGRVGVIAIAVVIALTITQGAMGDFSSRNVGFALGSAFLPWLLVSVAVFFSRRRWSWLAIAGTYLVVALLVAVLRSAG